MSTGNIYSPGQCTWYCWEQAPWVRPFGNLGNGMDWAPNWIRKGQQLSPKPIVGTIASFRPGADGVPPTSKYGHVAMVIAVAANGTFSVHESNWDGQGHYNERSGLANVPGVGFLLPPGQSPTNQEMTVAEFSSVVAGLVKIAYQTGALHRELDVTSSEIGNWTTDVVNGKLTPADAIAKIWAAEAAAAKK